MTKSFMRGSAFVRWLLAFLLACAALAAQAQQDPPGRVGRVADSNGGVSWWDAESGQWLAAERNLPLTAGDRIATAGDGRAELRVGSTVLRLANSTELEVLRLDDDVLAVQLHSGSLALRVRTREVAAGIQIVTEEALLRPQQAGHYRVDRIDDTTWAGSWRGELRVDEAAGFVIGSGQRAELQRSGPAGALRYSWGNLPADGFTQWVTGEDQREDRTASTRFVSPEMTGAEDLDRYGRWEQDPEFGPVWLPTDVDADWAPYRYGRWAWVAPWGWTWVDDARWGFAPFHYGRWMPRGGRWAWVPGAYVARPVYAPALVAWIAGPDIGISVRIGGPAVGWVPLAPREVYRPVYRTTPGYVERVNPTPRYRWNHPPGEPPRGPVTYANQGVPRAVTVVPADALARRLPIGRELREGRGGGIAPGPQRPVLTPAAPPPRPVVERPPSDEPGRGGPPREAPPREGRPAAPLTPEGRPEGRGFDRVEPPGIPPRRDERRPGAEPGREDRQPRPQAQPQGQPQQPQATQPQPQQPAQPQPSPRPQPRAPVVPAPAPAVQQPAAPEPAPRNPRPSPQVPAAAPSPAPAPAPVAAPPRAAPTAPPVTAAPATPPPQPAPRPPAPARPAPPAAPVAAPPVAPPVATPPAAARPAAPEKAREPEEERRHRPEAQPGPRERETQR